MPAMQQRGEAMAKIPMKDLELDKVNVRLPDGLRNRIKAAAASKGRSLNSEIVVALLERYPEVPDDLEKALEVVKSILAGDDDLEQYTRAALVEGKLRAAGFPAKVEVSDHAVTFRLP